MKFSLLFAFAILTVLSPAQTLHYPDARKSDQVDDYYGTRVSDPYRWLENDRSEETKAWVAAENRVTSGYFDHITYRPKLLARLEQLQNYVRYTPPFRRGNCYFFRKNDGLQNQSVVYVQTGLKGTPEVLLDPNRFSADGTSRLGVFAVSKDGRYAAYTVSTGGSDWQEGHIIEVATRKVLPDRLSWLKIGGLGWAGNGFFYSRYPEPAAGRELSSKNENQSVYFHRVGTPQSEDELVYEDQEHTQRFNTVQTTYDEKYAFLTISERGKGKDGNALYFRNLLSNDKKFKPIVTAISDDRYAVIDNMNGKFLIETNADAPNSRVALYDPVKSSWSTIIAERPEPLNTVNLIGGKLVAEYAQDVASQLVIFNGDGKQIGEITLPAKGVVRGMTGEKDDRYMFYEFTSLNIPETIYRYDLQSANATVFHAPKLPGFDAANYESKEIFYNSKDGTRIPMFLVHKRGLQLDGTNPTLLYAYGGFNIGTSPTFSALRLALLEQGFVYASANIRGGGEYGDKWHKAGMRFNKQNVFDDFIAAAQWLITNKYTSSQKLAIHGVSNGGLLIGATINQRPDLFRVAVAQAGVMDMLRFQKFTIGWNWIADYGSSDDPRQFKNLLAYSPLQNIHEGVKYPATLITTADHDDRVIPGHSFKFAATLQAKASPANPVLIRIDTNSGHGPSSTKKALEQATDIYAFILHNLGITPKWESQQAALR